ncbi:uncharacterized protein LOC141902076 [Tubulanus polymorphus]|uniref:uncharacterized protein LOC141902076 n=1 Tax=Tubulanus polymorphus TaxID=672921 RepID=UPI003DA5D7F2
MMNNSKYVLIGHPGPGFVTIHTIAVSCLSISIIVSTVVIAVLFTEQPACNLRKKKRVERFVIYLQFCDLLFNVSHLSDHIYIFAHQAYPTKTLCLVFAFLLNQFVVGTPLMTMAIALNTFLMVVMDKKLSFGVYDWRLWLVPMGLPFIFGIIGVSVPYYGPSGSWCFIDMSPKWKVLNSVHSSIMILVFFGNCILYLTTWIRIKHATNRLGMHNTADMMHRKHKIYHSAHSMTVFVSAYVLQYTAFVVNSIWALVSIPTPELIMATVFFTNLGGPFNCVAYTIFRRYTTQPTPPKSQPPTPEHTIASTV